MLETNPPQKAINNKNPQYKEARMARDPAYDGIFFFAVKTTGIVCRPSCKAPMADEKNVLYYQQLEEAIDDGFRPCMKCHPTQFKLLQTGEGILEEALVLMEQTPANDLDASQIAKDIFISERRLRQVFNEMFNTTLSQMINRMKIKHALELLSGSDMSITEVSYVSGYNNQRHFNNQFKKIMSCSPNAFRNDPQNAKLLPIVYEISLPESYDINPILSFLSIRIVRGLEILSEDFYSRTYQLESGRGYLEIDLKNPDKLIVSLFTLDVLSLVDVHRRIVQMFDLEAPIDEISKYLSRFEMLKKGFIHDRVPRISIAFDENEFLVRAIMGQQISIKAATTLTKRIVERASSLTPAYYPPDLNYYFPRVVDLADMNLDGLGITVTRANTLTRALKGLNDKVYTLDPRQDFESFKKSFKGIKGIGDWTVNYVAMRGIGIRDSFPALDLGIIRVLERDVEGPLNQKTIEAMAEPWRPYRAYATHCIWERYKKEV